MNIFDMKKKTKNSNNPQIDNNTARAKTQKTRQKITLEQQKHYFNTGNKQKYNA